MRSRKKRGLTGLTLIAIITTLALVMSLDQLARENDTQQQIQLIKEVKRSGINSVFQTVVRKALDIPIEGICEARVKIAAQRLASLEGAMESEYAKQGIKADLWFGRTGEKTKCATCLDLWAPALTWEGEPTLASTSVLFCDESNQVVISNNGQAFTKGVVLGIGRATIGIDVETKVDKWSYAMKEE